MPEGACEAPGFIRRPATMPQPDRNAPYLLGLDIGGTKLAVVIADWNGNILHKVD